MLEKQIKWGMKKEHNKITTTLTRFSWWTWSIVHQEFEVDGCLRHEFYSLDIYMRARDNLFDWTLKYGH